MFFFLFLAYILEVDGLNWDSRRRHSPPRSLVYWDSSANISLSAVVNDSKYHLCRDDQLGNKSDLVWQRWVNVKRGISEGAERTKKQETKRKENNNNTKRRNYQNSIQAQTWQLRAGPLRPLMKGWGSPSVKKTPDGCNVNKEWVSGLLQCLSQITVRCWPGSGGAELLVSY